MNVFVSYGHMNEWIDGWMDDWTDASFSFSQ